MSYYLMELNIDTLRALCKDDTIMITNHVFTRMRERNIDYDDVKNTVLTGKIIGQYPDDFSYPSCLVLGCVKNEQPLHVVVGVTEDSMWIVTAYYPDEDKWENNYEHRKEHF